MVQVPRCAGNLRSPWRIQGVHSLKTPPVDRRFSSWCVVLVNQQEAEVAVTAHYCEGSATLPAVAASLLCQQHSERAWFIST